MSEIQTQRLHRLQQRQRQTDFHNSGGTDGPELSLIKAPRFTDAGGTPGEAGHSHWEFFVQLIDCVRWSDATGQSFSVLQLVNFKLQQALGKGQFSSYGSPNKGFKDPYGPKFPKLELWSREEGDIIIWAFDTLYCSFCGDLLQGEAIYSGFFFRFLQHKLSEWLQGCLKAFVHSLYWIS